MQKLPDSELEIMLVVWECGGPVTRSYIEGRLKGKKNWADSTVLNFLYRLIDRGFVSCKKEGNRNIYTALISEEDYLAFENRTFLERLHKSSLMNFVASLSQTGPLTQKDVRELREFLDSIERETDFPNTKAKEPHA